MAYWQTTAATRGSYKVHSPRHCAWKQTNRLWTSCKLVITVYSIFNAPFSLFQNVPTGYSCHKRCRINPLLPSGTTLYPFIFLNCCWIDIFLWLYWKLLRLISSKRRSSLQGCIMNIFSSHPGRFLWHCFISATLSSQTRHLTRGPIHPPLSTRALATLKDNTTWSGYCNDNT